MEWANSRRGEKKEKIRRVWKIMEERGEKKREKETRLFALGNFFNRSEYRMFHDFTFLSITKSE